MAGTAKMVPSLHCNHMCAFVCPHEELNNLCVCCGFRAVVLGLAILKRWV